MNRKKRVFDKHNLVNESEAEGLHHPHSDFFDHLLRSARHHAHRTHMEPHELANEFINRMMRPCLFKAYGMSEEEGLRTLRWLMNLLVIELLSDPHRALLSLDAHALFQVSHEPGPLDNVVERELKEHLKAAISTLTPRHRELLVLKYESEMTTRQIAEHMGLSEANVRVGLMRARHILHLQLESIYFERQAG